MPKKFVLHPKEILRLLNNNNIKRLSLQKRFNILNGNDYIAKLANNFKRILPDINQKDNTEYNFIEIIKKIGTNNTIERLHLNNNQLSNNDNVLKEELISSLKANNSLRLINFSENYIDANYALDIVSALKKVSESTCNCIVNFMNNQINFSDTDVLNKFIEELKNSRIKELILYGNDITPEVESKFSCLSKTGIKIYFDDEIFCIEHPAIEDESTEIEEIVYSKIGRSIVLNDKFDTNLYKLTSFDTSNDDDSEISNKPRFSFS